VRFGLLVVACGVNSHLELAFLVPFLTKVVVHVLLRGVGVPEHVGGNDTKIVGVAVGLVVSGFGVAFATTAELLVQCGNGEHGLLLCVRDGLYVPDDARRALAVFVFALIFVSRACMVREGRPGW